MITHSVKPTQKNWCPGSAFMEATWSPYFLGGSPAVSMHLLASSTGSPALAPTGRCLLGDGRRGPRNSPCSSRLSIPQLFAPAGLEPPSCGIPTWGERTQVTGCPGGVTGEPGHSGPPYSSTSSRMPCLSPFFTVHLSPHHLDVALRETSNNSQSEVSPPNWQIGSVWKPFRQAKTWQQLRRTHWQPSKEMKGGNLVFPHGPQMSLTILGVCLIPLLLWGALKLPQPIHLPESSSHRG